MLKPSYEREEQIPENLKGAYVVDSSGAWVLDDLDAEHPIVRKNKELQREKTTLASQNTQLSNAKTLLETKSIPEGYVAVKAEDAPIIEKVKNLGIPLEEIPNLKTENDRFKQAEQERNADSLRRGAAKSLGFNEDAFSPLAKNLDLVQEGESFFVNTKSAEGKEEKKPLTKEFIESSDTFKPFLSSLSAQPPKPGNGGDPQPAGAVTDTKAADAAKAGMQRRVFSI